MKKELLHTLRNQIQTLDEEIIYLLSRRFEIAKQVGNVKKELDIEVLQPEVWENILTNLHLEADEKGVNKNLITDIWNLIHEESLNKQHKNT